VHYQITWKPSARKAFLSLDKPVQRRIATAVDALAADPRPAGVKALRGMPGVLRIRVADYRVLYEVHDDRLVVLVADVGHRKEIYR
jgi:mRNA interferase RelE/StbE